MMRLGGLIIFGMLLGSASVQAEEAVAAKEGNITAKVVKQVANLKTEYNISGDYVTTTTTVEKTNAFDRMLGNPLFETFQKTLKNMAFVSSVVQTPSVKTTETNKWWDYEQVKAKSNAFVVLSLSSPVTLLFQIEETYRKCVVGKNIPSSSEDGGSNTSACKGETSLNIKGPIAVYGNYATAVNVDALMRDKAEIDMTLAKSWSGTDTTLTTRFSIKSVNFDSALARFFRILNVPVFTNGQDVSLGNGALSKATPLTSRQSLMLGIARIARQSHERMLLP